MRAAIQQKQYRGEQVRIMIPLTNEQLLTRIAFVFTPKVEVEGLTAKALCCISYSLSSSGYNVSAVSSASFSFAAGQHRYVATSLHGQFKPHKQSIHNPVQWPEQDLTLLADAFSTDEEKVTSGSEVGHVVCDRRNDYVDVGLIRQPDEYKPTHVWYTEAQLTEYMVALLKATFDINWMPARVLIHSPPCFCRGAGEHQIPGTLIMTTHASDVSSSKDNRYWHFRVQLDAGHETEQGQSGSAVTFASDGRPIGMLVGRFKNNHSIAVVTPLHHIYASLNDGLNEQDRLQLCACPDGPGTVAAPQQSTKSIKNWRVYCQAPATNTDTLTPYTLKRDFWINGLLQSCCKPHTWLANCLVEGMKLDPLAVERPSHDTLPPSCRFW